MRLEATNKNVMGGAKLAPPLTGRVNNINSQKVASSLLEFIIAAKKIYLLDINI